MAKLRQIWSHWSEAYRFIGIKQRNKVFLPFFALYLSFNDKNILKSKSLAKNFIGFLSKTIRPRLWHDFLLFENVKLLKLSGVIRVHLFRRKKCFNTFFVCAQGGRLLLRYSMICVVISVTKFGENSPLWQIIKNLWQYISGLLDFGQSFQLTLAQFVSYWVYFHCWKWPNIENALWSSGNTGSDELNFKLEQNSWKSRTEKWRRNDKPKTSFVHLTKNSTWTERDERLREREREREREWTQFSKWAIPASFPFYFQSFHTPNTIFATK